MERIYGNDNNVLAEKGTVLFEQNGSLISKSDLC